MCHRCRKSRLLNASPNGSLFYNEENRMVLLEFKNICFDFYEDEYLSFVQYICGLEGEEIERKYRNSIHRRKIPVPVGHACMTLLLNSEELSELKFLFTAQSRPALLKKPSREIQYQMIYN